MMSWGAANRLQSVLVDEQWIRILETAKTSDTATSPSRRPPESRGPSSGRKCWPGKSDRDLVQPGDGILIGVRARTIDPDANLDPSFRARGPVQVGQRHLDVHDAGSAA